MLCAPHVSHAEEPATPHLHIHIPLPFEPVVVGSNLTSKTTVPDSHRLLTGAVAETVFTADPHFGVGVIAPHVSHAEEPATPHLHIHIPLPFEPVVVGSNFTPITTVPASHKLSTGAVAKTVFTADPHFHTVESVTSIFIIYLTGSIRGLFGIEPLLNHKPFIETQYLSQIAELGHRRALSSNVLLP